jgi:hypothetical protein
VRKKIIGWFLHPCRLYRAYFRISHHCSVDIAFILESTWIQDIFRILDWFYDRINLSFSYQRDSELNWTILVSYSVSILEYSFLKINLEQFFTVSSLHQIQYILLKSLCLWISIEDIFLNIWGGSLEHYLVDTLSYLVSFLISLMFMWRNKMVWSSAEIKWRRYCCELASCLVVT